MEGHQIFVEALTQFAEQTGNSRLSPLIRRIAAPLRIAVWGRDGVGCRSVCAALTAAGVGVDGDAEVDVLVVAESLKPEERDALAGADRPILTVLNKADLTGFGPGGPLAAAHRRAAHYRALTGVPTVPMVALLAVADLDEELVAALRVLVSEPADLTSTDAFVQARHPLPTEVRRRLLDTLDRFGIAHAVRSLGSGIGGAELQSRLRELSQLDTVVAAIEAIGAPVRYRRLTSVMAELHRVAAQSDDDGLQAFLSKDDTVLAMMAAAVDVVEAAGVRVDRADDDAAHLRRAVHWRRYSQGPVNALHRSCGADICRGSLRLLGHRQ